jgi:peptidoglycan hydrolase-like protein with peptidoglycan-binding domain
VLLQSELNALDDRIQLALDGVFGQQTRRAVLAFQRDHGLRGDGIVGPRTWEALDTSVASLASPVASR